MCAVGGGGVLSGEGRGTTVTATDQTPYLVAGARGGVELALSDAVAFHLAVDALAPLLPTSLRLRGADVWTSAPVVASAGAGIVVTVR